jgi:hypothetical protein
VSLDLACGKKWQRYFAFMATVLQPSDYKLVKAACLNTLLQLADRVESAAAAPRVPKAVRQQLKRRISTSFSGALVARQEKAVLAAASSLKTNDAMTARSSGWYGPS